nr:hypothetical protein [Tanacetum cinerariifolium]
MNDFCSQKGIKREFSNARTPQQNGIAERRNRTLIEAARTMLADAKLPVTFWAEAVNTVCYVQNRVLVNKSHNKTPYELFNGKFEEKGDEGYFIGYSMSSKAFRVFNKRNQEGRRKLSCTISTNLSSTKDASSQEVKKDVSSLRYIALPNWTHDALLEFSSRKPQDHYSTEFPEGSGNPNPTASTSNPPADQMETLIVKTPIPTVSSPVLIAYSTDSQEPSSDARLISKRVTNQEETPSLDNILSLTNRFEDIFRVSSNSEESNGMEADISNMETSITASPTPTLRIHKDHPKSQIIGPLDTLIQTRNKSKEDLEFPAKVYKVEKAMYGLHQAHRAWYGTLSKYLLKNGFQRGTIDHTLFIRRQRGYFILVQVYVDDIIFGLSNPQLCREFEALMHEKFQMSAMGELNFFLGLQVLQKKDDIRFAVCACARYQVTPKECHLYAVKRIFRYLKSHPKLGLWYPKESHFDRVAYSNSDYGGATQDRKSTTGGCQFLEYVAAASCCGQVLWIQNQLHDYGHHFIRDCFEKKLIDVDHIHTDENVADLLTKPFDAWRFHYLVDRTRKDVDLHLYRSLMYLTASRPDIMFAVCACAGHQVTPKECHLHAIKRIFRYLKEKMKEMMQLVPVEDVYVQALQFKHLIIDWKALVKEYLSIRPATNDKEMELWVELKRMYEPDPEDQLWTLTQNFMHAPVEWKLYDLSGVHHVTAKDKEISMLVEKDYPLRRGLALVMISYKLQVKNYSQMAEDFIRKIYNIANTLRLYTAKTFDLVWIWLGGDYGDVFLMGFDGIQCPSFSGRIVPLFDAMLVHQDEGSGTPTEPHHTPSPEAQTPSHTTHHSSSLPPVTTTSIPTITPSETTPIRHYTKRTRIAQSSVPLTIEDEPASPYRDVSQGEAYPTDSGFMADQDRATIDKSFTLPQDSAQRVTSLAAEEGKLLAKFQAQEVEINRLKERVKILEDKEEVIGDRSEDDAPIKGRRIYEEEVATERISSDTVEVRLDKGDVAAERASDDTEEMATVLTTMDAAIVLASGTAEVPTGSGSIPTAGPPAAEVPTGSDVVPIASPVFATATVIARELKEQLEREDQRRSEQIARDEEIARIHVEEELQIMIDGLDRSNEIEGGVSKISEGEAAWLKRKGIRSEQESAKKQKISEEVLKKVKSFDEVPEEKIKEMMQLVPIKEVYVEALQVKHPIIDWKVHTEAEWKLYDKCGVHQLTSKDKDIFMLVEKDYPLRKGLNLLMISYKLQVENYLQMADDLVLKIYNIANSPRQQGD